ncbi:polymer-forming cytoskeletal protein, partial [Campylobacter vulpis]
NAILTGGQKFNTNLYLAIVNDGTINGDIEIKQGATLNGGIGNTKLTYDGKVNGNIKVNGTVNGNIGNYSGTITGSIEIQENANVTGNIRLGTIGSKTAGKVEGDIIVKGTLNGDID